MVFCTSWRKVVSGCSGGRRRMSGLKLWLDDPTTTSSCGRAGRRSPPTRWLWSVHVQGPLPSGASRQPAGRTSRVNLCSRIETAVRIMVNGATSSSRLSISSALLVVLLRRSSCSASTTWPRARARPDPVESAASRQPSSKPRLSGGKPPAACLGGRRPRVVGRQLEGRHTAQVLLPPLQAGRELVVGHHRLRHGCAAVPAPCLRGAPAGPIPRLQDRN